MQITDNPLALSRVLVGHMESCHPMWARVRYRTKAIRIPTRHWRRAAWRKARTNTDNHGKTEEHVKNQDFLKMGFQLTPPSD